MSNTSTRVGLIGSGYIADWHADAIRATTNAHVSAVCDLSRPAAEALAAGCGAQVFTSVDDMIAANVCDTVHILTPPESHRDLAVQTLNAGLHTLVEKPIATSLEQVQDIVTAAKSSGKIFAPGHNFLGIPSYERLKQAIADGKLGRVSAATFNWCFPLSPLRAGPFGIWMLRKRENLLLELGPHLFAFATDLFGTPEIEYVSLGKEIDLPSTLGSRPQSWRILARAGDVDLTFNLSMVEDTDDRTVKINGSSGIAHLDYASDTLVIGKENASDIVINPFRRQMGLAWEHAREGSVNLGRQLSSLNRKSPYGLSFQGAFREFYNAVQSGRPIDPRFGMEAAETVMAAIDQTLKMLPAEEVKSWPKPKRKPKPTVLVIGGTGFIGADLTRSLVRDGYDVRVQSRGRSGPFEDLPENVEMMSVSLKDPEGLRRAMDGIDVVYHLAKSMDTTWEACLENDVGVTVGIAEAALDAGVKRFIYTGTIASYDMSDPSSKITEDTGFGDDMTDRNLYARSKAECERRLLEMHKTRDLPLVIARPGIVVGPGGPLQHWGIGRWHGAGAIRIWGHGNNILPFVLIGDVSDALIKMIDNDAAIGESFNIVGEPMMSARDYFDAIHDRFGARIDVRRGVLTGFFLADGVKFALKKYALRRPGVIRPSLRDWKSRAHFSPFVNDKPKKVLGWTPEADKDRFVQKAIVDANLFGF